MFDLKYYALLKDIKNYVDNINDYSKFKNSFNNREGYFNLYNDFFYKLDIDDNKYSTIRLYLILCDIYFKDYETDVVDKKYSYYKKNIWNVRKNQQLTSMA